MQKIVLNVYFLIRQSFVAVFEIDDAAILKSPFEECALHWGIVAVGVNAQILTASEAFIDAKADNSLALLRHGNAVNNAIRCIV